MAENTSTAFKISLVLLASWVLSCLSLCIFRSHLLSLWSESSDMQQPFPQQQQLEPAVLQQGTVMRCWRDVCSRGEQWVERSDAFWSEVDSNIVWGTACWTADVPFPQCKSLFFPVCPACWSIFLPPQTSLPFQNIPFSSSSRQILTSWAPARTEMGSTYQDQGCSPAQGEGCLDFFLQGWETSGLADSRPGVLPAPPLAVASAGLVQVVPETFIMSSPASTGLYLSQSYLIRWCLIMPKWVAVLLCKSCSAGFQEEHWLPSPTAPTHICSQPS